jgi:hypothetical protein
VSQNVLPLLISQFAYCADLQSRAAKGSLLIAKHYSRATELYCHRRAENHCSQATRRKITKVLAINGAESAKAFRFEFDQACRTKYVAYIVAVCKAKGKRHLCSKEVRNREHIL